jgi:hypothetical protein
MIVEPAAGFCTPQFILNLPLWLLQKPTEPVGSCSGIVFQITLWRDLTQDDHSHPMMSSGRAT